MEDSDVDSLEAAFREGEISEDQYEALKARLARGRARQATGLAARRLLWTGLILVAILVIYTAFFFLDNLQRIAVLGAGLGGAVAFAALLWRRPERFVLSRGLLGLSIFLFAVLLILLQSVQGAPGLVLLAALTTVTALGAILGVRENSTWLATPSVVSFYVGFMGLGIALLSFYAFVEAVFVASIVIAALIVGVLWAWGRGRLRGAREWYRRREATLGQLGRGHFVLFTLFVFFALVALPQLGGGLLFVGGFFLATLIPFGLALAGLLYAWRTANGKLLTVASLLILVLGWFFVPFSGITFWPIALAVTAAVLIYLGLRSRWRTPSGQPSAEPPEGRRGN